MRTLKRNLKTVYYAYPVGKEDVLDGDGNSTGEYTVIYCTPIPLSANVGLEGGKVHLGGYNLSVTSASRTLVSDDMNCTIPDDSVFWIDTPIENHYNYVLSKPVQRSLNSIKITVERVKT